MDIPTSSEVVEHIEAFLVRHGMAQSRFGAEATGDPNLVAALRKGASPSLQRLHRIAAYMNRVDEAASASSAHEAAA